MSQQFTGQPQQYGQGQQVGRGQQSGQQAMGPGLQSQVFGTRNYLPQNVREEVVGILNRTLADTTVLLTQAKFAHWNVKGQDFYGLHQLFDEIAEMFEAHADEIGERITAMGGQALGTAGQSVSNRQIPSMPTNLVMGMDYVQVLADHLAIHDANLHEAINAAQQYDDVDTVDLLNEVSREVSKNLWFLEAYLQNQPVSSVSVSEGMGTQQGQITGGGIQGAQTQQQPPTQQTGGQQFQGPETGQQPPTQQTGGQQIGGQQTGGQQFR